MTDSAVTRFSCLCILRSSESFGSISTSRLTFSSPLLSSSPSPPYRFLSLFVRS